MKYSTDILPDMNFRIYKPIHGLYSFVSIYLIGLYTGGLIYGVCVCVCGGGGGGGVIYGLHFVLASYCCMMS